MTGGHHSSAVPVIHLIQEKYPDIEIFWVGHRHSSLGDKNDTLEFKEIISLGIPFFDLKAGKVYKTFNIVRLIKVPFGFIQAFYYLLKIKPDVVLSFGGYLAVPVVFDAWILGIPSLTHEQTVVVGYANKFISRFVKKVLVSWEESIKFFSQDKVVFTGIPLRKSVFEVKSNSFKSENGLPTIYITAGKSGSHFINELIKESLSELLSFCNVIHQCGNDSNYKDYDELSSLYSGLDPLSEGNYFLRKYVLENEVGEAFSKASLVVSRSGAHIISELAALEKPSLLIPISWVSHDEQNKNAQLLKDIGLAKVLDEKTLSSAELVAEIRNSLLSLDQYKSVRKLDLKFANSDQKILDEVIKQFKK